MNPRVTTDDSKNADVGAAAKPRLAEVSAHTEIRCGMPLPFGTHGDAEGVNFALFSRHASRVRLELFDNSEDSIPARASRTGVGETPRVRARLSILSRAPGGSDWLINMSMTTSVTSSVRGRRSASRRPGSLDRILASMSLGFNGASLRHSW